MRTGWNGWKNANGGTTTMDLQGRLNHEARRLALALNALDTARWRVAKEHGPWATMITNANGERLTLTKTATGFKVTGSWNGLDKYNLGHIPQPVITVSMVSADRAARTLIDKFLPSYRAHRGVLERKGAEMQERQRKAREAKKSGKGNAVAVKTRRTAKARTKGTAGHDGAATLF